MPLTEAEFIQALNAVGGSRTELSRVTGINIRNVQRRCARLEERGAPIIQSVNPASPAPTWAYPRIQRMEFENGVVIVYSDAHYWPGTEPTLAFRALLHLCSALNPAAIVANGDLIDGAKISRFPSSGWAKLPGMKAELEETQTRQAEIKKAVGPRTKRFRTVGNHDLRLDRFFVTNAEQFAGVPGTRLADFLPDWPESWSVKINDTFIKHRFRGGDRAAYNNAIRAGTNIVTGHLHKLQAEPTRGYRDATIWGIETGTLANSPADLCDEGEGPFEYLEDNPTNWASGFAVLTYYRGRLLPPEFCRVEFGKAWFRGQEVK